ncbi:MAG: hypothetical protein JRM76_03580 [Nitrososphaerota archaeon]|jgi:hypothetical protein|nr:hypothetical protein [Nitrososphaerota archaeon]MDG6913103.1 hypothetical protein [Nitrososphaerota archaeon]MDG6941289.1 hypothetical protein [Nitrososphaerota archaeon]MDG6981100.1 hypothetical protein [Nitrososphaerota archaeon]MDG6992304.1 hypothetical protein [Nitrososphaerota archaeon]
MAALLVVVTVVGLRVPYETAVAAASGLGIILALHSILSGTPVRPWVSSRHEVTPAPGPVVLLVAGINKARKGSYFSQAQVARILRAAKPRWTSESVSKEILEPPKEGHRLKGDEYVSNLRAVIEVLKDD